LYALRHANLLDHVTWKTLRSHVLSVALNGFGKWQVLVVRLIILFIILLID
jgi:hypothetical protein